MSDSALRRTIRRCTAALLLPLSLWPVMFVTWLDDRGYSYHLAGLELGDDVALLLFVAALSYLAGSFAYQTVVGDAGTRDPA